MAEPEKPARDRGKEEEPARKSPMFSHKGLIILVAALMIEAVAAAFLARAVGGAPSKEEKFVKDGKPRITLLKKRYVDLDGPTFSISVAPNVYQTVQIRWIRVEVDPDLNEDDLENLETSINNLGYEIKQSLQELVEYEGHENLLVPQKRQRLQNKLKREIIQMLGVTDKEVKAVIYDTVQIQG